MRAVAVFDTNVLLSGLGWKGKPYQCIELARNGVVDGVTCRELIDELAEKLEVKLGMTSQHIDESLADLLSFLHIVPITGALRILAADPDDDKVLECAAVAGASHIVTGDRRHLLPLGRFQGISIVTPADFLLRINSRD